MGIFVNTDDIFMNLMMFTTTVMVIATTTMALMIILLLLLFFFVLLQSVLLHGFEGLDVKNVVPRMWSLSLFADLVNCHVSSKSHPYPDNSHLC